MTPEDVTGNLNDKVSLECKVDSNPEAVYEWKFNDQFIKNGPLLNLDLTNATTGTYSCEASVAGFPSVSHSLRVRLRGPPRILMEQGTQFRWVSLKLFDVVELNYNFILCTVALVRRFMSSVRQNLCLLPKLFHGHLMGLL